MGLSLALPTIKEGSYARLDLALLLRPRHGLPELHQIAKGLNPSIRRSLTLRVYGASDYAVTADGGDFTCHIVVGVDPEGRMYLLDLWRKQASSDAWVEAFCD